MIGIARHGGGFRFSLVARAAATDPPEQPKEDPVLRMRQRELLSLAAAGAVALSCSCAVAGELIEYEKAMIQHAQPAPLVQPAPKPQSAADTAVESLDVEQEVDPNTEDVYWRCWVIDGLPKIRVLRTKTSDWDVLIAGLAAGAGVELLNAVILHPFDTVKTRLQALTASRDDDDHGTTEFSTEQLTQQPYAGISPVLASIPVLSIFWAVKDFVRRRLVHIIAGCLPWRPWGEILASSIAALCGEAAYWAVKAPSVVVKTQQQSMIADEDTGEEKPIIVAKPQPESLWREVLASYPVLAIADVPTITIRSVLFVAMHATGLAPEGSPGMEVMLFTLASATAALATTPLDAVRTQLLLEKADWRQIPDALANSWNRGLEAMMAGWQPRLLWNGLVVGAVMGLVRLEYNDMRAVFLLNWIDHFQHLLQPLALLGGTA